MSDFVGKIIAATIIILGTIVLVFSVVAAMQDSVAKRTILNEMQQMLDEIVDTRQCTEEQKADFYLGISGLGPILDVKIERYVRTVDPNPNKPGELYTTYVYSDDTSTFNQGDKVKVTVKAIRYTGPQRMLHSLIGIKLRDIDYSFAERVR